MLAKGNFLHSGWVSREETGMRQAALSGFDLQRDEYPLGPAEYSHQIKEELLRAVFPGVNFLDGGGFLLRQKAGARRVPAAPRLAAGSAGSNFYFGVAAQALDLTG